MKLPLGGIGDAFSDRNFRLYSVGAIVSWLSFFVQLVAASWTTWELTHSTRWLAIVAVLDMAPAIAFLPLGGALADRVDRVHVLVVTYGLALLQALALTGLAAAGQLTVAWLGALAFCHGLIHSFSMPGLYGLLPRFVAREKLPACIAVASAYTQFAVFAGPALAGWIIVHGGVAAAFATNVAGYAIYLVMLALLRSPVDYHRPMSSGRSVWGDIGDGVRYMAGHRGISSLLALTLIAEALQAATTKMLPAYAASELGLGVDGLSKLLSAAGFGATLSALWLAQGGAKRATPPRAFWAFLAFSLAVACLMLVHTIGPAILAMIAFGLSGEIRRTVTVSVLQLSVRDDQRGRVMSTQYLLQQIAGAAGVYAVGAVADTEGLRAPMLVAVLLALTAWGALFVIRREETGTAGTTEPTA